MKVCIVSDYVDPANWGGAARVAAEQAIALKKLGHKICLVAASGSNKKIENIKHISWIRRSGFLGYWQLKKNLFKAIKEFKPDLIILHQPLSATMVQRLFKNIENRYFFHSSWVDEVLSQGKKIGIKKRGALEREALRNSNKIFVTSPFTQSVLERVCPGVENKTLENPLAVNSPPFLTNSLASQSLRDKYNIPESHKVLVSFRRLTARTGIDLLLDAVAQIGDVTLLVGGTGEDESKLKEKSKSLGLSERVFFLGYLKEEDMIEALQGADAAVVPSKELEGFGLFTVEALACGCPIIATPVGNNKNLLESCGYPEMVSAEISPASLKNAIEQVLSQNHNPNDISRNVLRRYSWKNHVEILVS